MKNCSKIDDYIDGRLPSDEMVAIERHLVECPDCRVAMDSWNRIKKGAAVFLAEVDRYGPTEAKAAALVRKAGGEQPNPKRVWVPAATLVSAVAAAVLFVIFWPATDSEPDPSEPSVTPVSSPVAVQLDQRIIYETTQRSRLKQRLVGDVVFAKDEEQFIFELGADRFGLEENSRAQVMRADTKGTRVRLLAGAIAVQAVERKPGKKLIVEAKGFTVEVVGTRFMVAVESDSGIGVDVAEGTVQVSGPGLEKREISAGDAARFDETASSGVEITRREPSNFQSVLVPPLEREGKTEGVQETDPVHVRPAPPAPEPSSQNEEGIADWQGLILSGRLDEAKAALERHLVLSPDDVPAWALLADCRRKQGRWQDSVNAYQKVIELGPGARANRARLNAAVLLQDKLGDPSRARELYRTFLESGAGPRVLEPEVKVRLASCYLKLGKHNQARGLLEDVVENHRATSAAIQARRMLDEID